MKRLKKISLQVIAALIAVTITLAARGDAFRHTAMRTTLDCYKNPVNPTVGICVDPTLLSNTDFCTLPATVYCCYTFETCVTDATKVKVTGIVLFRGI